MNSYTLASITNRGNSIVFRPSFCQKPVTGTVIAIDYDTYGGLKRVYVEYFLTNDFDQKIVTHHEWVSPRRVFHVDPA